MGFERSVKDLAVFATWALDEADRRGEEVGYKPSEPNREVNEEEFFDFLEDGFGDGRSIVIDQLVVAIAASFGGIV